MSKNVSVNLTVYDCYILLKQSLDELSSSITTQIQEFKEEVTRKFQDTNDKILNLERENKLLKKKIEYNEKEHKKSNVLIFGLTEKPNEDIYARVIEFFKGKLQIPNFNIQDLSCAHRFGKSNEQKPRPILVKLLAIHRKTEILRNGHLLKNSGYSISNDLTQKEREDKKILRKHLKEAKNLNLEATIKQNKLFVNDKTFTVDELKDFPRENAFKEYIHNGEVENFPTSPSQPGPENRKYQNYRRDNNERNEDGSSSNQTEKSVANINSIYNTRSHNIKK